MRAGLSKIAADLKDQLDLAEEPVAVSFLREVPQDVPKYADGAVPAGCSFWLKGRTSTFYTVADDHHNCPIGTLTQGFSTPTERSDEAHQLFSFLVGCGYVKQEELENAPRVTPSPAAVAYGPLSQVFSTPDAVLITCNGYQSMLLSEAVASAGPGFPTLTGRPTCAAIPVALNSGTAALSVGCIGNRVYTGLGPQDVVMCIPGSQLAAVASALSSVVKNNADLETIHSEKKAQTSQ